MVFKKFKYNIIFALMLVLIIGVVGFEVYQTMLPVQNPAPVNPDGSGGEGGGGEVVAPPSQEDLDDFLAKNRRLPNKIVTHALEKLYDGKGYKSTYEKTMTNSTNIVSPVVENIKGTIERCGDKALEKLTFTSDSSYGVNNIRAFYHEGSSVTQYQTAKGKTAEEDFVSATKTEMTREQYMQTFMLDLSEKPIFKFMTASISSTGKENGREYTVINAQIDIDQMNSCGYCKYYETTGDLKNVNAKSGNYTFYIYNDTCQIYKIVGHEEMSGTNPQFGVSVKVTVEITQRITLYNQEFEIGKP